MPVLLPDEKPPKRNGPSKCQIFTVIFIILAVCGVGVYIFYTKYFKKAICSTEECLKSSVSILATLDTSVNPCEDFRQFTCGNYLNRDTDLGTEPEFFSYPKFVFENRINFLIADTKTESGWKLLDAQRHFYNYCRDTPRIDEDQNQTLLRILNETGGWPMLQGPWNVTNLDLTHFLFTCYELGIPFERFFKISFNENLDVLQLIAPAGLEEFNDDARKSVYINLMVETVTHLGGFRYTAEMEAEKLIELEKSIAKVWANYNSSRDEIFTSNDIRQKFPKIDLPVLLENIIGEPLDEDNVTATNVDVISDLNLLLSGTPSRTIVNFVIWKFIEEQGPFLASPLREKFHVFFNFPKSVENDHELSRRDVCLGEAKKRFPRVAEIALIENAIKRNVTKISSLVKSIKDALISRIDGVDFLAKETKKEVTDKLKADKDISFSLYDDVLPNLLQSTEIYNTTDNVFHMAREQNVHNFNLRLRLINESRKVLDEYLDSSMTEEISFTDDAIEFPPFYLQEYFYTPTRSDYLNFAAIGTEISKQYVKQFIQNMDESNDIFKDILGNTFTWTNQDMMNLFVRSRCAAQDYVEAGMGEITAEIFSENCEDLMSVDIAYEAYQSVKKKLNSEPYLPLLPYNPNQLFWISFARRYCSENAEEHNGVSLEYRQLNVIKNSRYFAKDFSCPTATEMNPERKCIII